MLERMGEIEDRDGVPYKKENDRNGATIARYLYRVITDEERANNFLKTALERFEELPYKPYAWRYVHNILCEILTEMFPEDEGPMTDHLRGIMCGTISFEEAETLGKPKMMADTIDNERAQMNARDLANDIWRQRQREYFKALKDSKAGMDARYVNEEKMEALMEEVTYCFPIEMTADIFGDELRISLPRIEGLLVELSIGGSYIHAVEFQKILHFMEKHEIEISDTCVFLCWLVGTLEGDWGPYVRAPIIQVMIKELPGKMKNFKWTEEHKNAWRVRMGQDWLLSEGDKCNFEKIDLRWILPVQDEDFIMGPGFSGDLMGKKISLLCRD